METPNNSTRTILIDDDCVEHLSDDSNKLCWLKLENSKYAVTVRGKFDMSLVARKPVFGVSCKVSLKPVSSGLKLARKLKFHL